MSTGNNNNNIPPNHSVILSTSSSAPTATPSSILQPNMGLNYPAFQNLFSNNFTSPTSSTFLGNQLPSFQSFPSSQNSIISRAQMASEAAAPIFDNNIAGLEPESALESKKRRRFTKEEDDLILSVVPKFESPNGVVDWDKVFTNLPLDRSREQIKTRYSRLIKANSRKPQQNQTLSYIIPPIHSQNTNSGLESMLSSRNYNLQPLHATPSLYSSTSTPSNISSGSSAAFDPNLNNATSEDTEEPSAKRIKLQSENIEEALRKLHNDIGTKTKFVEEYEKKASELRTSIGRLNDTLKMEQTRFEQYQQKVRQTLEQLLREKAERDIKEEHNSIREKAVKIGTITYERKGLDVFEVWQDGEAFMDFERRIAKLNADKERYQNLLLEYNRRKQSCNKYERNNRGEVQFSDEYSIIIEQLEVCRIRWDALLKEESLLNEEKRRLNIEKSKIIREIKRMRDQERSRFSSFSIINDRYLLMKLLGRGGFSEVYKAYDLKEMRISACKIHQLNSNWKEHRKENYIKHVLRECHIHKSIKHDRVIQMYDTFIYDNNTFVTVLEFCDGLDLDLYIKTFQTIPEHEARNIIAQVFSGLKYLNEGVEKKIIHFDLKPANILYNEGEIKITDFGLSKIMEEEEQIELTSQGAGTYWYLPPECFEVGNIPKISSKVDVWSAGVVFFQMLYGKKPFGNELSQQKILSEQTIVNARDVQFPEKPQVSEEGKEFIRKCLTYDQAKRPDVSVMANDPYLRGDVRLELGQLIAANTTSTPPQPPSSVAANMYELMGAQQQQLQQLQQQQQSNRTHK